MGVGVVGGERLRETDRETERETERHRDRETQRDRDRETERERFKWSNHGEFIVHTKTKTSR